MTEIPWPIFEAELEIRAKGDRRFLSGRFPYSPGPGRRMATIADRGKTRKERIGADAFGWQMREFAKLQKQIAQAIEGAADQARLELLRQELERRNVHVLSGHSFDRPLGDMKSGSAKVTSTQEAVSFEVDLPPDADQPSYMRDTLAMIKAGLAGGVSPGFRVPPASAVADAEGLEPEPGNYRTSASFMAIDILPSIFSLPIMKAVVGLSSPLAISRKSSREIEIVQSASSPSFEITCGTDAASTNIAPASPKSNLNVASSPESSPKRSRNCSVISSSVVTVLFLSNCRRDCMSGSNLTYGGHGHKLERLPIIRSHILRRRSSFGILLV